MILILNGARINLVREPQQFIDLLNRVASEAEHDAARLPDTANAVRRDVFAAAKRLRKSADVIGRQCRRGPLTAEALSAIRPHYERARRALDQAQAGWASLLDGAVCGRC